MALEKKDFSNLSSLKLSLELWSRFNKKRRIQLFAFLVLSIFSSISEAISIASIIPFLSVLASPEKIISIPLLNYMSTNSLIFSPENIRLTVTLIFVVIVIFSGLIRLITLWYTLRLAASVGSDISSEIFKNTITRPYLDYSNSSESISTLNNEVLRVIYGIIIPQLILLSSAIICFFLSITLILINFKATLISATLILIFYYFSIAFSKNIVSKNSIQQVKYNRKVIQTIQESFGFIREIILNEKHKFFINDFNQNNYKLNLIYSKASFINTFPRVLIEPFGIAILSIVGCITISNIGFNNALPLIGTLVLGSQRIIPLMQKIYEGIAKTRGTKKSLIVVLDSLNKALKIESNTSEISNKNLESFSSLEFKNVHFKYPGESKFILKGINLKITKGDRIAIIGESGSGKSTLIDLLIGLMPPTKGQIYINDLDFNYLCKDDIKKWRKSFSLIPQSIYLSDSSIKENIAFGEKQKNIKLLRVDEAIKKAVLKEFVKSREDGIETIIGENGFSLSGGQQQRLGIARGLYKGVSFLLLDEATNALDLNTERKILDNISQTTEELTLIIITHRKENLNFCNRIFEVVNGNLLEISN